MLKRLILVLILVLIIFPGFSGAQTEAEPTIDALQPAQTAVPQKGSSDSSFQIQDPTSLQPGGNRGDYNLFLSSEQDAPGLKLDTEPSQTPETDLAWQPWLASSVILGGALAYYWRRRRKTR